MPDVTVVIPTHDRREMLQRTLASVLAQERVDLEVVIVDDGSRDGTAAFVAGLVDDRIRLIRHETAHGVARARNAGVAAASAPCIAFLDDDDVWAPTKLRSHLELLRGGASWAFGGALHVDPRLRLLRREDAPPAGEVGRRLRALNPVPAGSSNVVVERETFDRVGGFDERLAHLADWDLWIRLAADGDPGIGDDALVAYVQHSANMRAASVRGVRRELRRIDAKHSRRRGRSDPERVFFDLWIAEGHVRAGATTQAAVAYARAYVRTRDREYRHLARLAIGNRLPRFPPTTEGPEKRPAWLDQYATAQNGA